MEKEADVMFASFISTFQLKIKYVSSLFYKQDRYRRLLSNRVADTAKILFNPA